ATGQVRDLRSASGYSWNTGDRPASRQFRIDMKATTANSGLRITDAIARPSARAAGGLSSVAIRYNGSAPAEVEVRALGAPGRSEPIRACTHCQATIETPSREVLSE